MAISIFVLGSNKIVNQSKMIQDFCQKRYDKLPAQTELELEEDKEYEELDVQFTAKLYKLLSSCSVGRYIDV